MISIGHSITNDNSPPVNLWNWETKIKRLDKDVVRQPNLPWGGLRHHLQQSQRQTFPRVLELQNHRQENLYFIVVRWVPVWKQEAESIHRHWRHRWWPPCLDPRTCFWRDIDLSGERSPSACGITITEQQWTYAAAMKSSKVFPYYRGRSSFHREYKAMSTDLVFSTSSPVPFSTKFTSTPYVRNSQDCVIRFHKSENDWTKEWSSWNRESTITCQAKQRNC